MLDHFVIHVGMPKTGTTAIQDAMAANRSSTSDGGYWYPETATHFTAHHPLAWSATLQRKARDDVAPLDEVLDALTEERADRTGMGILSSEALFHVPEPELVPLVDWCRSEARNVIFIAYVLPPAALHEGWYRQLVKSTDYRMTFDEYLGTAPIIDTHQQLAKFAQFDGTAFHVRPYLRATFWDGNIINDFVDTIGLDQSLMRETVSQTTNATLSAELTEFKLYLNREGVGHTTVLERALIAWEVRRNQGGRSLFSEASWSEFIEMTQTAHKAVLADYSLPHELQDRRPLEFTRAPLRRRRFEELLVEFARQYPGIGGNIRTHFDGRRN